MNNTAYFERLASAEQILERPPTLDSSNQLLALLAEVRLAQKVLTAPISREWLETLWKCAFFDKPLAAVKVDGGKISFPGWTPVFALASNVEKQSELVGRIAEQIPSTDNDWINGHLMDVALKLPPELSVKWLEREIVRISKAETIFLWLPMSCRKMIAHLATGGQASTALKLAKAVLGLRVVRKDGPSLAAILGEESKHEREEASMKVGHFEYEEVAKAVVEHLAPVEGVKALELLSELLAFAIAHDGYEKRPPSDHSYVWRPEIAESEHNYRHEAHSCLVTPLRDVALAISADAAQRSDVVDFLLHQEWHVFWRIALHLVATQVKPGDSEMLKLLDDGRWVESWESLPEYFRLLNVAFPALDDKQRSKYLEWVESYPDVDGYTDRFKERGESPPNEEQVAYFIAYRKVRLLWPLRDVLPESWARRFKAWHEHEGGRDAESREREPRGFRRVEGPKTSKEIAAMTVPAVMDFLKSWIPDSSLKSMSNSARALSHELTEDVKHRPRDYFQYRDRFLALGDPTWCGALLFGFQDQKWLPDDWDKLLPFLNELLDWGPDRKSPLAGKASGSDFAEGMTWCRMCIVAILKRALAVGDDTLGLPWKHSEAIWAMLLTLLGDPDPKPETVSTRSDIPDYAQTAMNHVRSDALQTAIYFGVWWLFNKYPDKEQREKRAQSGSFMAEIPGLVSILDRHLDSQYEQHPAVWAVYGFNITWLIWLGRDWVESNLPVLFPDNNEPPVRRDAVWTTLIRYYRANITANEVLRTQFVKETERLTSVDNEKDHVATESKNRLGIHLMIMYWWKEIALDGPPLKSFFSNASDNLRANAVQYIGNQYADFLSRGDDRKGEDDPTELLKALWLARNKAARDAKGKNFAHEMAAFLVLFSADTERKKRIAVSLEEGEWTGSAKPAKGFDDSWALDAIADSLQWAQSDRAMYDTTLAKKFASFAGTPFEKKATSVLTMLIQRLQPDFGLPYWLSEAEELIKSAAKSSDKETEDEAFRLINILGSVGVDAYRYLLPPGRGGIVAVT